MKREAKRLLAAALMMTVLMMMALSTGCGDGLEPTGRITKARIVGVQSIVQEDRARTSARPGETLDVTLLVTQPGEPTLNTWAFIICEPAATTFGVPRCEEGEPLAIVSAMTPVAEAPFFSFRIPEGTDHNLLYVGGVCLGGTLDPALLSDVSLDDPCAESGVGRLVTGALRVQVEGAFENHMPRIDEVTLDGEAWTSVAPMPATGCRDMGLPVVSYANEDIVRVEVFPSDDSRETSASGEPEELPVAFFSTERGLTRFYSVIDDLRAHATADFDTREITETDAQTIPTEGRVVRFEFVMRDDHGGVDRETRALCLMP